MGSVFAYLDHASTTAVRPEAQAAIVADLSRLGNPSSLHAAGRDARRVVEEARELLAASLEVRANDLIFTSGGTEGDNLALKGMHAKRIAEDPARKYIVISEIEHHAVLDSARALAKSGTAEVVLVPTDEHGVVDLQWYSAWLAEHHEQTSLVSIMLVNNETGVIQPVAQFHELAASFGVPFHTDGVQGAAWVDAPGTWMTAGSAFALSGHKIGAPIGVGALILTEYPVAIQAHGGGQEVDRRSGTLAAGLASSLAAAAVTARSERVERGERLGRLRAELESGILASIPDCQINGSQVERIPGTTSVSIAGLESDALLMLLDAAGVGCSAGSACQSGIPQPSHVLLAMGLDPDLARGSIRFSLGWNTTEDEVAQGLAALPAAVERARAAYSTRRKAGSRTAGARTAGARI